MRILLIEDNTDHIFLARQAVDRVWGQATLHIAHDPDEARARYCQPGRSLRFDVLLVSLDARDANRLLRLRQMQECLELTSAPIIALASSTRDQELAQVAHQPVDWIILKPLRAEALLQALQRRPLETYRPAQA